MRALKRGISGEPVGLQAPYIEGTVSFPKAWEFVNPNRQEDSQGFEFRLYSLSLCLLTTHLVYQGLG